MRSREIPLEFDEKKSRELWPTNYKVLYVGYISDLRGAATSNLHALEIDQRLLAHTPTVMGIPKRILIVKI